MAATTATNFSPALDLARTPWFSDCTKAGCDRRIKNCSPAKTGGVSCVCSSAGLDYNGNGDDGGNCLQWSQAELYIQARKLDVTISKPIALKHQQLKLRVNGETDLAVSFVVHEYDVSGRWLQSTQDIDRFGMNGLRMFGMNGSWAPPEVFAPRGAQQALIWDFGLSFDCSMAATFARTRIPENGTSSSHCVGNCTAPSLTSKASGYRCAVDGDVAKTVVSITTSARQKHSKAPSPSTHNVSVTALVAAIPSCTSTVEVTVDGSDTLRVIDHKSTSGVTVKLYIVDVDKQPITFSLPELSVEWNRLEKGGATVSVPSSRQETGSHIFTSSIGADLYASPGRYELTARLYRPFLYRP